MNICTKRSVSSTAAYGYVGYRSRTPPDQRKTHADQVHSKRCLRYPADTVSDYHRLQHERQEHLHSICCSDDDHGTSWLLVCNRCPLSTHAVLTRSSVPANYASFPIMHQLFARLGMDDNIETNVSTFAAEMREIAFILRNVDQRSL